jgi:hypothetical protein
MTDLDDVVHTIELSAARASDGAGMIERVQASAARIRRRRRMTAVAASAAVVLVAAAAIPVVTHLRATPAQPAVTHYRDADQLTVKPAEGSAFSWRAGSYGALQWMAPYRTSAQGDTCCAAMVLVYDPGAYDPAELRKGEKVTAGGHEAWFGTTRITSFTEPPEIASDSTADVEVPTLGWQDGSGAWVTVVNGEDGPPHLLTKGDKLRRQMYAIAADVRLTPPRDILVPMHFPAIPGNLPISFAYADVREDDGTTDYKTGPQAAVGFGGTTGVPSIYLGGASTSGSDAPLEIVARTAGQAPWTDLLTNTIERELTAGGHPARYTRTPWAGGQLLVEIGTCGIEVRTKDPDRFTAEQLAAMFDGATFDACDSTATWTEPLG